MMTLVKKWGMLAFDVFLLFIPFTEFIDNAGKIISALCGAILTGFTVRKLRQDYRNRKIDQMIKQEIYEQERIKRTEMDIRHEEMMEIRRKARQIADTENNTALSNI